MLSLPMRLCQPCMTSAPWCISRPHATVMYAHFANTRAKVVWPGGRSIQPSQPQVLGNCPAFRHTIVGTVIGEHV